MDGLLLFRSDREGGKCTKDGTPLPLTKVIGNIVHVPYSPRTTELGVELLGGLDEITGSIHFVCAFNLTG